MILYFAYLKRSYYRCLKCDFWRISKNCYLTGSGGRGGLLPPQIRPLPRPFLLGGGGHVGGGHVEALSHVLSIPTPTHLGQAIARPEALRATTCLPCTFFLFCLQDRNDNETLMDRSNRNGKWVSLWLHGSQQNVNGSHGSDSQGRAFKRTLTS